MLHKKRRLKICVPGPGCNCPDQLHRMASSIVYSMPVLLSIGNMWNRRKSERMIRHTAGTLASLVQSAIYERFRLAKSAVSFAKLRFQKNAGSRCVLYKKAPTLEGAGVQFPIRLQQSIASDRIIYQSCVKVNRSILNLINQQSLSHPKDLSDPVPKTFDSKQFVAVDVWCA